MINSLLQKARALRKARYLKNELFHTKKKYAFVGIGMHSLTNLYPILHHFGICLKFICTKSSSPSEGAKRLFPGTIFTNRFEDILEDEETEGVFICASPSVHFDLLSKSFASKKKVFVEKPPCTTTDELLQLINAGGSVCKVGLQRRYWPGTNIIQKKVRHARTYSYRFTTGPYLDGDILTELFIHPLDYIQYLFGSYAIKSSSIIRDSRGTTLHLHVVHDNKVSGLIECSTHYSWNTPTDILSIDTSKENLRVEYPMMVEGQIKPSRLMNIPFERLLNQSSVTQQYFSAKNFILPVQELNTLYLQGFYGELETFINLVEGKNDTSVKNDLPDLEDLYRIIEQIKNSY